MKTYLITFAVIGLLGALGTAKYKWNKLVEHNTQLTLANNQFAENEKKYEQTIKNNNQAIKEYLIAQTEANITQAKLQQDFIKLQEEAQNAKNVFNKKEGRYQRLLQEKGTRIIKLSNAASKRMRDKWRKETSNIIDRLQEEASSLYSSTSDF